jgi:hypothetical protein
MPRAENMLAPDQSIISINTIDLMLSAAVLGGLNYVSLRKAHASWCLFLHGKLHQCLKSG